MSQNQLLTILSLVSGLILSVGATNMNIDPCQLASVEVQQDFNMNRYLGKWYIKERYSRLDPKSEQFFSNHQHTYLEAGDGEYDVFIRGKKENICTFPKGSLTIPPSSEASGKLRYRSFGRVINYWVLGTDYEKYAVVLGYRERFNSVLPQEIFTWVLVRSITSDLGEDENASINTHISKACLQRRELRIINHEKPECRQCDPSTWTVQPNFRLERYLGLWNEIVYRPAKPFPLEFSFPDYSHTYTQQPNGTVRNRVIGRNPADNNKCFVNFEDFPRLETTIVPGKLQVFDKKNTIPDDYWVIETDYTGYAFVLGCVRQPTTDAPCSRLRSWVWARDVKLDGFQFIRLNKLFDQYCIDEDEYIITSQVNPCPKDPNDPGKIQVCVKYDKADVQIKEW